MHKAIRIVAFLLALGGVSATAFAQLPPTNSYGLDLAANNQQTTAPTNHLRLRYNASTGQLEQSISGSSYAAVNNSSVINVKNAPYNCKGDGVTDDTACIQAAINVAKAQIVTTNGTRSGGEVFFPAGVYILTGPLNMQASQYVRLEGVAGFGAGFGGGSSLVPPSVLMYTGGGSSSIIQLNSSFGTSISYLGILYNSSSFTGFLIDYGHLSGVGTDASYNVIENCLLGSNVAGAWNAAALVSWNNGDFNILRQSHLQGAVAGVRFRETLNDYADANRIEDSLFRDFQVGHIMNAGNQELVQGNVFEGNQHQGPPLSAPAYTTDISSQGAIIDTWNTSFNFVGNWVGDYPLGATQFDTSPDSGVNAYNLRMEGNFVANVHLGNLRSATISNNALQGAVTFDVGGTYTGVTILDNIWFNAVTYTNLPAAAFVKGNTRNINTVIVNDQMTLAGPFTATTGMFNGNVSVATGSTMLTNTIEPVSGNQVNIATTGVEIVELAGASGVTVLGGVASGSGFSETWNSFFFKANNATSGSTLQNSSRSFWRGEYWNGTASTDFDATLQLVPDTTTPTAHLQLVMNGVTIANRTSGGAESQQAPTVASATTIAPVAGLNIVSGAVTIQTITPPPTCATAGLGCCIDLAATGAWATNTAGNIATTGFTATTNVDYRACYVSSASKWYFSQ